MSRLRFRVLHTATGYKIQIKAFWWRDCDQKPYPSRSGGPSVWVTNYYLTKEDADRKLDRLIAEASHKTRVVREVEITL